MTKLQILLFHEDVIMVVPSEVLRCLLAGDSNTFMMDLPVSTLIE